MEFISKNRKYIIISISIILIIIFILSIINKTSKYNIVYKTNNKIVFYTNKKIVIDTDDYDNIKYSNLNNENILYTKDDNLYLNNKEKIIENVLTYTFSNDDKYIITLDKKRNLYTYDLNNKILITIDDKVDNYITYDNNYLLYIRNDILYLKEINKDIIFEIKEFNYDNSPIYKIINNYLYYINNNYQLIKLNITDKKEEIIAENVNYFYIEDYKILIEHNDLSLSYYDKITNTISKSFDEVLDYDFYNNEVLYLNNDKLYYYNIDNNIEITNEDITSTSIIDKNKFYYITNNKLYYCTIKDNKLDKKIINENVYSNTISITDKGLIYIIKNSEENGNLYLYNYQESILIDKEVALEQVTYIDDNIYYLKKNSEENYDLKEYSNKTKIIVKNVLKYKYYNNKSLYYINTDNELYYKGLFNKKIDDKIIDIK